MFVEDPAIVLENLAVITRPGAKSRRIETVSMEEALSPHRQIERIVAPGTIEGGDVVVIGKTIYVGRSSRSNDDGIVQLGALTAPFGYDVKAVQMTGCLHLKTGCSLVAPDTLLVNRDWIDVGAFEDVDFIDAHPDEEYAGNALLIGENVIHPAAHEKTRAVLESRGINVTPVEYAELAKAESGVTCCSIIFESDWVPRWRG
ncbi:MAG: dimethylargininase [Planctomycetes bacterium]|nr:dimethylargininase [Planctomycetota bacterium]